MALAGKYETHARGIAIRATPDFMKACTNATQQRRRVESRRAAN